MPRAVKPMLARLVGEPFHEPGWIYEEKYDGDRLLALKNGAKIRLISRNGKDRTGDYPAIAAKVAALPPKSLILDGEVVVFDAKGVSRFQELQKRAGAPVYVAFDCLYRDGRDLRALALSERRAALEEIVPRSGTLRRSRILNRNGFAAFRLAKKRGFEGLVAKKISSPYAGERSSSWLKVKVHQEDEFVILGYTPPEGARKYFGALLLGAHWRGKMRYAGRVGTGFDDAALAMLHRRFRPLVTETPPTTDKMPGKSLVFLKPRLVAQISYQELTADRKLRQPVFLGLRADKAASDVTLPVAR